MDLVEVSKRQTKELLLILPLHLAGSVTIGFRGRWGRISDLGDEIRRRCLRNTIYQHAEQWYPEQDVESNAKAEQQALPAAEPVALLLACEMNTGEVWLEQFAHEPARGEVGLQEDDNIASREEYASAEDDRRWTKADSLVGCVETCGWQDKTADDWQVR